jgi:hypothetical protein
LRKILLFSRDPGGANCIIEVAKGCLLSGSYTVDLYGKDSACISYANAGLKHMDITDIAGPSPNRASLRTFLQNRSPDIIVTGTSADDNTETFLWQAAADIAIPSVVILDYWNNYSVRFSEHTTLTAPVASRPGPGPLPDVICIMDEFARMEMLREGFPAEKLRITGQPYLDTIRTIPPIPSDYRRKIRQKNHVTGDELMIVYVSEPIRKTYGGPDKLGYDEVTILQSVIASFASLHPPHDRHVQLTIRPHPKNTPSDFNHFTQEGLFPFGISIDTDTPPRPLIQAADLIVGMSSIFLLEAALLSTPLLNVQIGLRGENTFVLARMGSVRTVTTKSEMDRELSHFVNESKYGAINFDLVENSTENIIRVIEEILSARSRNERLQ